ncbi:MAG: DUF5615 family PIN-like protein [Dehalococcoidia bacterium]
MIALYLDEDIQSRAIAGALATLGFDILTTADAGRNGEADHSQLEFAALLGRAILTANVKDFARLHTATVRAGRTHAGILLVTHRQWSPGELARRIAALGRARDGLVNDLVYLSDWPGER